MVDCSKTENYFKEKRRMCSSSKSCVGCEIKLEKGKKWCFEFCEENPKKAIEIVQKWSDEHPQKTMLSDFKKKHPNAQMTNNGIPKTCPYYLGYVKSEGCPKDADGFNVFCVDCWNRPYNEEGQK